jgi:hypothetical protein
VFTKALHCTLFQDRWNQSTHTTSYFFKNQFSIILPSSTRSPMWSLSLRFSDDDDNVKRWSPFA